MAVKVSDRIDCTQAQSNVRLFPVGIRVRSVTVVECPTGRTVQIQIGGGTSFPMGKGDVLDGLTDADSQAGIIMNCEAIGGIFSAVGGGPDD